MRSFAFVPNSKGRDCEDTNRAMDFFDAHDDVVVEEAVQGSRRATELWAAAEGSFAGRKDKGHPLVLVVEDNSRVLWAAAEPSEDELEEALALVGSE